MTLYGWEVIMATRYWPSCNSRLGVECTRCTQYARYLRTLNQLHNIMYTSSWLHSLHLNGMPRHSNCHDPAHSGSGGNTTRSRYHVVNSSW